MSYRPYYTNTEIDGKALNGAIQGIGGLFGKGKMTATPSGAPTGGEGEGLNRPRPNISYSTSGGDFWDNVFGRQAQMANVKAAEHAYGTEMDLYKDQGLSQNKLGFNSQDRIGQFNDKARIARMIQGFSGDTNPGLAAMSMEQENQLDNAKMAQEFARNGMLRQQLVDEMQKQGIINRNVQANTEGQIGENQFQQRSMDPRLTSMELGNQAARQSIDQSRDLHPYNIDKMSYGNMLANKEVQGYDALQAAKIRNYDEANGGARYFNPSGIPGTIVDRITGELIAVPMEPNFEESQFGTNIIKEQKGMRFNPKGQFQRYPLGSGIPQASTGLGGYGGTNYGVGYNPAPGTNAPSRRIPREQLDKLLGK